MTAEGHILFAFASAVIAKRSALTPVIAGADWWHLIPATLLTCLLPDIDHPGSLLGQRLRWISKPMARAFGHRGFTHSLIAIVGGVWLLRIKFPGVLWLPADVMQGMVLGYLSHIVADMLTPAGVPLLWPCRWRFCLPLLHSQKNNQLERIFCISLVMCAVCLPGQLTKQFINTTGRQLYTTAVSWQKQISLSLQ
ncbi:metal-dependent hydrolase [Tatumella sp. UBA2305]|uniref:metal-dependent hydrolase n=1 Tax=Tatumella sp. UBA2305 TaxID=1947647 RepID=UPI0025FA0EDA|nr:metal-dependent hydrolase [Tatumella sp. UBA2305]